MGKIVNSYIWFILLGTIITIIPAFNNGFPFVYSDTGAYIHSGFTNQVPTDRPIFYGLFIRHISLATSLWLVIFVQAFILNFFVFKFIQLLLGSNKNLPIIYLGLTLVLCLFTSMPWFASLLLPDIFTPIAFIILLLILFEPNLKKLTLIIYSILYLFLAATHLSNLVASFIFVTLVIAFKLLNKNKFYAFNTFSLSLIFALTLINFLVMSSVHAAFGGGFKLSKSSHVFLTGKLIENGIMVDFLKENCPTKQYNLCTYQDSLPKTSPDFLWSENSPLQKLGGWQANETEYKEITHQILTTPKWFLRFVKESFVAGARQTTLNNFGEEFIPFDDKSSPYYSIQWFFNKELNQFTHSMQNFGGNNWQEFKQRSNVSNWILLFSFCGLLLFWFIKFTNKKINLIFLLTLFYFVINALVTASLGSFAARYSSRFSWIFILLFGIALIANFKQIKNYKFNNE